MDVDGVDVRDQPAEAAEAEAHWRGTEAALWPDGHPKWAKGYLAAKRIPDELPVGRDDLWLTIVPLTFGRARVCVATWNNPSLEHW